MELFFTTVLLGLGVVAWALNTLGERFAVQAAPTGSDKTRLPESPAESIERRQRELARRC